MAYNHPVKSTTRKGLSADLRFLSVGVHVARAVAVVVAVDFADIYVVGSERVVFGS